MSGDSKANSEQSKRLERLRILREYPPDPEVDPNADLENCVCSLGMKCSLYGH